MDRGPSETRASSSPSHPLDPGGFAPGHILADRYRIVALVGRGGMGEVYRADDLRLGQPVALKFLPPGLERDPAARDRLLAEVRSARTVSHPNVCRVHDVGDVGGRAFLTMEYIDGEDLASLLRRIGKLPAAKALEVARQLCAGLAAAHDKGVLHRDLKPANVMIDGRGQARITDFGLAVNAQAGGSPADFAGTVQYMAPERFQGTPATVQSDLYGLGLILYETYTGKPAFKASSVQEWERAHADSTPSSPSALASEIEPAVDRAILRCLEKDPAKRPASAAQVAAALPGGGPLAAALAAGETPSPELVAASGEEGTLPRRQAWAWLAACLVAIAVVPLTLLPFALAEHVPFDLSPDTLQVRARDIVRSLGYAEAPADSVWWFRTDGEYLDRVNAMRPSETFTELRNATPGPVRFCYRQSAVPLVPIFDLPLADTSADNPRPAPGDVLVETDLKGRLVALRVLPMPSGPATSSKGVAWTPLMAAAQTGPPEAFVAVEPRVWPESAVDAREAREGTYAGEHVRLEAASRSGLPVFFRLTMPWHRKPGATAAADANRRLSGAVLERAGAALAWTLRIALFVLAWRNVRVGRGDRASALRLGIAATVAFAFAAPLTQAPPARNLNLAFMMALAVGLHAAIIYLGLEPALRRVWPRLLVTWTRLMQGQWRDPLVGRALLVGVLCGSLVKILERPSVYRLMNLPGGGPTEWSGQFGGPAQMVSGVAMALGGGFVSAAFWLGVLLVLRLVLRRGGLAWTAVVLLVWILLFFGARSGQPAEVHPAVQLAAAGALAVLPIWVMWKHGALALATTFCVNGLLALAPWTLDLSRWYAWRQFFVIALVAAIAVWGFRNVLGKQSALSAAALDG